MRTVSGWVSSLESRYVYEKQAELCRTQNNRTIYDFHRDLLTLRREDEVFSLQDRRAIEGAVLSDRAFALFYKNNNARRLLIVNLGDDLDYSPCSQPFLALPRGKKWNLMWGSEDVRYGGGGIVPAHNKVGWYIPGRSAQVLSAQLKGDL